MSMKYIFILGLPEFDHIFDFCHMPIDRIILSALKSQGCPKLKTAWSKLDDYDEYMNIQRWVRSKFNISPPPKWIVNFGIQFNKFGLD